MKRTDKWVNRCLRKTKFYKKERAEKRCKEITKKTGKFMRYYLCADCLGYHLTSKELRKS